MKIIFVVNSPKYFLSHRYQIAKKCIERGDSVYITGSPHDNDDREAIDFFKTQGIKFIDSKLVRGGGGFFGELRALINIFFIFKRTSPDLVHLITLKPIMFGGICSLFFPKMKIVSAIAGLGTIFLSKKVKFKLIRFFLNIILRLVLSRKNAVTIFQNCHDLQHAVDSKWIKESQARLIRGSGVNVSKYHAVSFSEKDFVVSFAGRLIKDKGIYEFVAAAKEINKLGLDIKMNIYGDIDPFNPSSLTNSDIDELSNIRNLSFHGHQSDMLKAYRMSHVICLPSYREGLPKSLVEASACGRPIITTDVPGCRDAIETNVTGFLVPKHDVATIVNKIITLYSDRGLLTSMGKAGRERACNLYDIRIIVSNHIEIYDFLISE